MSGVVFIKAALAEYTSHLSFSFSASHSLSLSHSLDASSMLKPQAGVGFVCRFLESQGGFQAHLCHLSERPGANALTSLSLNFVICKMGDNDSTSRFAGG